MRSFNRLAEDFNLFLFFWLCMSKTWATSLQGKWEGSLNSVNSRKSPTNVAKACVSYKLISYYISLSSYFLFFWVWKNYFEPKTGIWVLTATPCHCEAWGGEWWQSLTLQKNGGHFSFLIFQIISKWSGQQNPCPPNLWHAVIVMIVTILLRGQDTHVQKPIFRGVLPV